MGKDVVYSMRMSRTVRQSLEKAAAREHRTIASLLDKVIADYLDKEGYHIHENTGRERRKNPRVKTALPSLTYLSDGLRADSFPCVVVDLSLGGALIAYPRGSDIKDIAIGGIPNFSICFVLPRSGGELIFRCGAQRVFNIDNGLKVGAFFVDPEEANLDKVAHYIM